MTLAKARPDRLVDAASRQRGWDFTSSIADLEADPPRNANPSFTLVMAIVGVFQRGGLTGLKPEDLFPVPDSERAEAKSA